MGPTITVSLCGDVMLGRGIDQVLPFAGNPVLYEPFVRDARAYVRLAEQANGPISRPVGFEYPWGDALEVQREAQVDVRIINLETSITSSEEYAAGKGINYRMHPRNAACLAVAGVGCCCLANNHVLDWGAAGLAETLQTLREARIAYAGAGRDAAEAEAVAAFDVAGKGRVLVASVGSTSSGVPLHWRAGEGRPGVWLLDDLSENEATHVAGQLRQNRRPGAITVVSIHWGENWGYAIPGQEIRFAHRLIDEGVDIVFGHSSHHPKAIEVYQGRLILYGCGDFINDYEGISGYEEYRGDLRLMFLPTIDPEHGRLAQLRIVPMRAFQFRLERVSVEDAEWLCGLLNRIGAPFGTVLHLESNNGITLRLE